MEELNFLIRGGGIALALLAGFVMLRDAGTHRIGRLGAAFALGTGSYLICSAPALLSAMGPLGGSVIILCVANPALYWMFGRALFEERTRFAGAEWGPLGLLLVLYAVRGAGVAENREILGIVQQIVSFALVAHVMWVALYRRENDLIDARRAFRLPFAIATGFVIASVVIGEIVLSDQTPGIVLQVLVAVVVTAITSGALALLLKTRGERLFIQGPPVARATSSLETVDDPALKSLREAMETDYVWREEGLTIGTLAARLQLPEYRLRRLINRHLEFRNFSTFLNGYRVTEAKRRLADPKEARIPILTIALETGFASIGPFNRAFKTETGLTPSQFRSQSIANS
ncbi:MAG: helix-turn-helix domain-containing protein [Proteobacteria bacterium]|nr:helix-turn-helix domain-containing protein [Pseudomonadota bacterium]MDA1057810.1 helix-turn-helix domain-containing protein [Pseudomonadota bacterium]